MLEKAANSDTTSVLSDFETQILMTVVQRKDPKNTFLGEGGQNFTISPNLTCKVELIQYQSEERTEIYGAIRGTESLNNSSKVTQPGRGKASTERLKQLNRWEGPLCQGLFAVRKGC